jgi:hypothetical protein
MPKLGEVVVLQMAHCNDNKPCAAIVTKAADDGHVDVIAFPDGFRLPVPLINLPASYEVDELSSAYLATDPNPPAEGATPAEGEGVDGAADGAGAGEGGASALP